MSSRTLLTLLLSSIAATAQPPAEKVAPFLDEQTLLVVRVDVSKIDVAASLGLLTSVLGEPEDVQRQRPVMEAWVKDFTRKGGRDIFIAYGANDFPHSPVLIAPIGDSLPTRNDLAELLEMPVKAWARNVGRTHLHGCVCVGPKEALAQLKDRKAVARRDLMAALEAGKGGAIKAAVALTADGKKIFEQISPTLPPELGGGGIQKLTRGLQWMSLSIGPAPNFNTQWIVEASSHDAAHDLKDVAGRAADMAFSEMVRGLFGPEPAMRKKAQAVVDRVRTTVEGNRVTLEVELAGAVADLARLDHVAPADRMRSANNLKQLLIALHSYHDTHGRFPADIRDKSGKAILSWRVHLLPYVEQDGLYRAFKLDEPWDSPNNKPLLDKMPTVFRSPRQGKGLENRTTYLAPLGPGLAWDDPKGLKMSQIRDGLSNTIALVEVDDYKAIAWTQPGDFAVDRKKLPDGLLGHYKSGFHAAMADGSVRFISKAVDPHALWALFTRDDGDSVGRK